MVATAGTELPYTRSDYAVEMVLLWLYILVEGGRLWVGVKVREYEHILSIHHRTQTYAATLTKNFVTYRAGELDRGANGSGSVYCTLHSDYAPLRLLLDRADICVRVEKPVSRRQR